MTDRQLAGFMTVVEKGSFTAAAEALYISQSALSQQIAQLERQLGFSLFDRQNRQATLTDGGRAFYGKARQILSLYRTAAEEGQYLERMRAERKKSLFIGCVGEQFLQLWLDLFYVARESAGRYAPLAARYESRERLYEAILKGDMDVAIQLENPELGRWGLQTVPFARVEELCLFPGGMSDQKEDMKGRCILPEELSEYAIAFHNAPGASDYEDSLREYFRRSFPQTRLMDPVDFASAHFTRTALLVPAIQHIPHPFQSWASLDWEGGATACFVTAPNCDPRVLEYIQHIKDHITPQVCPWYLPLNGTE